MRRAVLLMTGGSARSTAGSAPDGPLLGVHVARVVDQLKQGNPLAARDALNNAAEEAAVGWRQNGFRRLARLAQHLHHLSTAQPDRSGPEGPHAIRAETAAR
jgi:hypothetical protein